MKNLAAFNPKNKKFDPVKWVGYARSKYDNRPVLTRGYVDCWRGVNYLVAADGFRLHMTPTTKEVGEWELYPKSVPLGDYMKFPAFQAIIDGIDSTDGVRDYDAEELVRAIKAAMAINDTSIQITMTDENIHVYDKDENGNEVWTDVSASNPYKGNYAYSVNLRGLYNPEFLIEALNGVDEPIIRVYPNGMLALGAIGKNLAFIMPMYDGEDSKSVYKRPSYHK